MSKFTKCPTCNKEMSSNAVACPNCGEPNKKEHRKKRGNTQGVGFLLMLLGTVLLFVLHPGLGLGLGAIGFFVMVYGFFI